MRFRFFISIVLVIAALACNKSLVPGEIVEGDFLKNKGSWQLPIDHIKEVHVYNGNIEPFLVGTPDANMKFIASVNTEVYSIANGIVVSVFTIGTERAVIIRNGVFYSVYNGLSETYVCEGEMVYTRSAIGTIDISDQGGVLDFFVVDNNLEHLPKVEEWFGKKLKKFIKN